MRSPSHALTLVLTLAFLVFLPNAGANGNDCARGPAEHPGKGKAPRNGHFVRCAKPKPPAVVVTVPPSVEPPVVVIVEETAAPEPTCVCAPGPATKQRAPKTEGRAVAPIRGPGPRERLGSIARPPAERQAEPFTVTGEMLATSLAVGLGLAGALLVVGRPGVPASFDV